MATEETKPCPFCDNGTIALDVEDDEIYCCACGGCAPPTTWNTRASGTTAREEGARQERERIVAAGKARVQELIEDGLFSSADAVQDFTRDLEAGR